MKTRSAVAKVENFLISRFEKAVGHLVSEKWMELKQDLEVLANGPEMPNEVKTNWHHQDGGRSVEGAKVAALDPSAGQSKAS